MSFEQESDEAAFATSKIPLWLLHGAWRDWGLRIRDTPRAGQRGWQRVASGSPLLSRFRGEKMKYEAAEGEK